jgi:CheY-like chemotaxis protein
MMDPFTVFYLGLTFAGARVAHKVADAAVESFWERASRAFKELFGTEPDADTITTSQANEIVKRDPNLLHDANLLLGNSSALRRARRLASGLARTRILWVDDHPENNVWERRALESLGVTFLTVERTETAEASLTTGSFQMIISDIRRDSGRDDGLSGLSRLSAAAPGIRTVFYVGALDTAGTPPGAFGITNDPEELFHLILDIVERVRPD